VSSHVSTEVLAGSGYDWLLIDTEHAPNELPGVHAQLQAIAASQASPIVRPAWNDTVILKRLLDIGVQTVLVPFVQNAEEARRAVAATRYPPHGVRKRSHPRQRIRSHQGLFRPRQRGNVRPGAGRNPGGA
jgi:4-hydroxy-2-oxoheptanedioate aldolase